MESFTLFLTLLPLVFLLWLLVNPSQTDGLSKGIEWLMIFSFKKIRKILEKRKREGQSLKMSENFFNGLASITVQVAVENVLLVRDRQTNNLLVWLAFRRDKIYGEGMWHCPGSILRTTDKPDAWLPDAFERVLKREFKLNRFSQTPDFSGYTLSGTPRGLELSLVFLCHSQEQPQGDGQFFELNRLPVNLIKHHYRFIQMAVEKCNSICM